MPSSSHLQPLSYYIAILIFFTTPTRAQPSALVTATSTNPFITPLSIFPSGLTILALLTVLPQAPFSLSRKAPAAMPSSSSDPRAAQASSSSSSREKSSSSSSSSSRDRPSSSSSSSSAAPPSAPGPPQGPYISANAWMSFFLFCCLVLIILQGPLGLSNIGMPNPAAGLGLGGVPALGGLTGGIGCQGMAAAYVPWCATPAMGLQPVQAMAVQQPVVAAAAPAVVHHHHAPPVVHRRYTSQPRYAHGQGYGAQGSIAMPGGGGQWSSWYNPRPGQ